MWSARKATVWLFLAVERVLTAHAGSGCVNNEVLEQLEKGGTVITNLRARVQQPRERFHFEQVHLSRSWHEDMLIDMLNCGEEYVRMEYASFGEDSVRLRPGREVCASVLGQLLDAVGTVFPLVFQSEDDRVRK
jgi:hypothetical protein